MSRVDEPFEALLENLRNSDDPLRAAVIYRLSEPSAEEFALLKALWQDIPVERRRTLLTRMGETSEANFELDFADVAQFALRDPDPEVRAHAIDALWTSEQPEVMYRLIQLLGQDPDKSVRAAAAQGLGQFVLLGELGHLSTGIGADAERALLDSGLVASAPSEIQLRALESLAYSSRREVVDLIARAAEQEDISAKASAILAMGRNGDQRWSQQVTEALEDGDPRIRFEAVRAAGELGLADSVPRLVRLAGDGADREIQEMAIWSLGEIGGDDAQQALFALADKLSDEDLLEVVEDAINMAALSLGNFGMYFMPSEDGDDDDVLDDLEEFEVKDDDSPEVLL